MSRARIKLRQTPTGVAAAPVVLVVDDDLKSLKLIRALLAPLALELVTAESAEEAFLLLRSSVGTVDLVLLDRELPGVDGVEFLRRLKADPDFSDLPVIMQTAAASQAQVREGLAAGASYYVTKPVEPAQLNAVVRAALRELPDHHPPAESIGPARACRHRLLVRADFEFRTLSDARELASELSALCPNPEKAAFGLQELMVNAIEHGNLEITFDEKSTLCRLDNWQAEVERRLELPAYRARTARVQFTRLPDRITFVVRDQGPGFRWQAFLDFEPDRAFAPNGRGIALAKGLAFSELKYEEPGNVVTAEIRLEDAS